MVNNIYPKISIVSPSYNQADFIEDAIQSVLAQHYSNFEHIIIDGGSTDGTIDILKKYPHLIWVSEKDKGQSDAINKGFNIATGDIVGWLNTDDYYLPGTFEKIIKSFQESNTDVVYGDIQFVDKNKNYLRDVKSHRPVKWLSLFHCYIHSAAFFFDKKVLDKGIRIDPNLDISMDKDFFANIFYNGFRFKYIPLVLTAFRWHENNKSLSSKKVRNIQAREGFTIFCRYTGWEFRSLSINYTLYRYVSRFLLLIRKLIKINDTVFS